MNELNEQNEHTVKKTVKGMTLVEIIIAMLVVSVAGVIMVKMTSISCNLMKSAEHLSNKVEMEAPMAASHEMTYGADKIGDGIALTISGDGFADIGYTVSKYDTKNWAVASGIECSGISQYCELYSIRW